MGLNDFDHADIYGHYSTESDFGKLLKQRPDLRDKIQLTTKCGIKLITPRRPEHRTQSYDSTKAYILKCANRSLSELATDHIDLLLIHRPDFLMNPHEIAEAFTELKSAGKVLHFGVSNFTPSQFDLLNSFFPLVNNQVEISISHLDPFEDGTLDQCFKHNIIPTAWSPLGGGSIFSSDPDDRTLRIRKAVDILCKKYEAGVDQILLAWLLKHPVGIIPVLGTTKISRIKDALAATKIDLSHQEWYQLWEASKGEPVP
jgi:predicted oxidoreductase